MKRILLFFLLLASLSLSAQTVLNVNGETHSYTSGQVLGYDVPRSTVTTFTFTNNLLSSLATTGYILQAGDDSPDQSATFNHLDGEVISGNKIVYNGTTGSGEDTHGIFTGHNINVHVRYNYVLNTPLSIVRKSTQTMTNTSGGVYYNIVNNPQSQGVGVIVKGINGVLIYNNTLYSNQTTNWRGLIDVYSNTDVIPNVPATGTKIKNNIFYTTHQTYNIYVYDVACLTGFESDYNIFYCEAGTPIFQINGTIYTFAQWQALGYDAHSQVINPNFINTTDFVPTARLDYGTNLGTTWNTGLSTSAVWTVGSAPTTAVQNGTWQVGARVFAGSVSVPTVTTTVVTGITSSAATSGGNVTSAGGGTVSAKGVCWNTTTNPTTANFKTTDGAGTGSYVSSITGLSAGITYYVRAYATNEAGTAYGSNVSFSTTGGGSGHTFYVSTSGNNSNSGSIGSPWATWDYGFNHIAAGDTLYIRGGTYMPTGYALQGAWWTGVGVDSKSGSSGARYNVFNYPGETPVLDCRNFSSSSYAERIGITIYNSAYWHLKGLNITRVDQTSSSNAGQGILLYNSNYNTIEQCNAYVNGGPGMGMRASCEQNTFLNCDCHDNYDAYTVSDGTGGDADGWDLGFITYRAGNDRINYLTGCRAWNNSDDGYDMYQITGYHGKYVLDNCWAWHQGYRSDGVTKGGDGNGFKYGGDNAYSQDGTVRRWSYNCIAYNNYARGFSQEDANVKEVFYNCIGYKNGDSNFSFYAWNTPDSLINNVSYQGGSSDVFQSAQTHNHNSWDSSPTITVTNASFQSISDASLSAARQSNGDLPVITFLHPGASSNLLAKGAAITGQTYDGDKVAWASPRAIGAFEYSTGAAPIPVTSITVSGAGSATTITVNGGTLQMSAAISPGNASNQSVTWGVTNGTGTATISGSGLLSATSNGTVTVRATANDGSAVYDDQVITISNQSTVILTTDLTINSAGGATTITTNGGTLQFSVSAVVPSNATDQAVLWSVVPGTGSATISSGGLLTAASNGTVTVWAYSHDGSGAYDLKTITISNQYVAPILTTNITIAGSGGVSTIVALRGTLQMVATSVLPANAADKTINWSVSNGTGAASIISSTGLLTALANGTVTVYGYAHDGSGVYDLKQITISGQTTGTPKILKSGGKVVHSGGKILIIRR